MTDSLANKELCASWFWAENPFGQKKKKMETGRRKNERKKERREREKEVGKGERKKEKIQRVRIRHLPARRKCRRASVMTFKPSTRPVQASTTGANSTRVPGRLLWGACEADWLAAIG